LIEFSPAGRIRTGNLDGANLIIRGATIIGARSSNVSGGKGRVYSEAG